MEPGLAERVGATPNAVRGTPHAATGIALIALSSLFFGSSGIIGKPAMQAGLTPPQVASARIVIAAVVLLAGVALLRPSVLRVRRGQWPVLVAYGLIGVATVQLLFFIAASRVPVGVAILLEFTAPVLIAFWVRFVRGIRLPRPMWAGIALAMVGLALVSQVWDGLRLDSWGLLAGMGAAVCAAAYFLLGEHSVATMRPLTVVTWGMVFGALAMIVVAPPWTLPVDLLTATAELGPWRPPVWVLLVAVALVSTVAAYLLGIMALQHLPAAVASVLALAEPVVATALAWAVLGELLSLAQLVGAVILLTGAAVVQRFGQRAVTVSA